MRRTANTALASAETSVARVLLLLVCLSITIVGSAKNLRAQTTDATINGQVTDAQDRPVPGVEVQAVNIDTNGVYSTKTNGSGIYVIPALPPGRYRLLVLKDGFKEINKTGLDLHVQDTLEQNFALAVGSVSESVTVTGGGLNMNTTDAAVSTVIDRQFVENMPLNGRSFQNLILLTPGVVTNSPQSTGASGFSGEFSVNGQRTQSNVYTVDGVNANTGGYIYGYGTPGTSGSLPAASALGTTQSLVSVDALQEFRVQSSSYSAEYGLSPGGQFSFLTRSGTNDVHGTVFDYLRNNVFDANDWFTNALRQPATALRQNDFGGTLGGPVFVPKIYDGRNKSFFFFSYEGLRLVQPQPTLTTYVPSAALRQSAPAALQPVLNAFAIPNGPILDNGLAAFVASYSLPSTLDSTSFRFDQQLTSKARLFFRFSDTQSATASRSVVGISDLTSIRQSSYTSTLGLTWSISERIANDFHLNYTSNVGSSSQTLDNFGGAQPANLLALQGIDPKVYPSAQAEFDLFFPGYRATVSQVETSQPQQAWNINDNIAITHARQRIKVGADYRSIASSLLTRSPSVDSAFNSSDGILANISEFGFVSVGDNSYPKYTNTALYVQDEIHATQRAELSLGIRWEVNPPPVSTTGHLPYIVHGNIGNIDSLGLAPAGTRFWKTTYLNFAPRLGVAYQARNNPGHETVIRAGGGVFFDSGQQTSTQPFSASPGDSAFAFNPKLSYPLTSSQINVPLIDPPVAPYTATAYYFPARLQLPYTLQWNVSVEQALGTSQSLTVSYVGSNGRRLLSQQQINPTTGNFSNSGIILENTGTTSSYNALQLKFQRTLSRGLQMLASYNYAHSIDFGSQDLDFVQIRGNSDFDLRHNFNLAATYDIGVSSSNRLLNAVVNHWGVDSRFTARTGFPVSLNGNTITQPNGRIAYSGLDLVPGQSIYVYSSQYAGGRAVNPAAFSLPAIGAAGDAPRNFVRGFGAWQFDVAVRREFPIYERLRLQFRAEAFNIFNHPDFGYINPNYGNAQFGQATKMLNQSLGNLSPLYQQGGPRSMQFALKLVF